MPLSADERASSKALNRANMGKNVEEENRSEVIDGTGKLRLLLASTYTPSTNATGGGTRGLEGHVPYGESDDHFRRALQSLLFLPATQIATCASLFGTLSLFVFRLLLPVSIIQPTGELCHVPYNQEQKQLHSPYLEQPDYGTPFVPPCGTSNVSMKHVIMYIFKIKIKNLGLEDGKLRL